MSIDVAVVVHAVDSLQRLVYPPSKAEVVGIFDGMGWVRRRGDFFPQSDFFHRGDFTAAVNDQDGVAFVTFNAVVEVDVDADYSRSLAVLDRVANEVIQTASRLLERELEDPGEEYDEPALDYIDPYYRRLGPWVLSMGLVHPDSDDPILLVLRMRYWRDLADDG
ncbi:hypothetical protein J3R08_002602 [Micromonospora sp. HB375]|uniref:hypothetical protein n=1 Tax=unclassified Micromonospora TaxID=2617518 RepID=UPI001AE70DFB|nr:MULTISPECIES: hypothetical protein [unclassified Micromonospora]MBP1782752.1 hypothetical protein [Micromonospora sp. HB375]MDH6472000.1 hypothetical protein [Micromonospora sp. H404/HB375]